MTRLRGAGRLAGLGLMVTLVAVVAPILPAAQAQPSATPSAASSSGSIEPKPVSLVVLVDESGSLTETAVTAERDATALIAQSEVATESQISVIGFGGNNGLAGQSPVDVVCRPTMAAGPTNREYLANCVNGLHRRTKQEGDSTDFPRAISQALSVLDGQPTDHNKIIFLLTDGKLDVLSDRSYGARPNQRNATALAQMRNYLAQANSAGVQVWPLGFGAGPDASQLADFASRGSQRTCGHGSPVPRERIVGDSAAVIASLIDAYTAARCAAATPPATAKLGTARSVDLAVTVPAIATDGSIAVYKHDPRVSVQYYDPSGALVPKSGTQGDSVFQVSGEGSSVEVLRVENPKSGTWKVRLISAPGVPPQNVSAQVIWQGAIRSSVSLDPPAPAPGQQAVVRVTLATRRNALTDPAALRQVKVSSELTGDGFSAQDVPLADDGQAPDDRPNDGVFSGQLTMPTTATGDFRLVGFVGGAGISSDELPFDGTVTAAGSAPQVLAQIRFEPRSVAPGGALVGMVEASSTAGAVRRLRIVLTDEDPGTLATLTPPTYDLPASGSTTFEFQVHFDQRSRLGPAGGRLRVLDDAKPNGPGYADRRFTVAVEYPPSLLRRLLWLWLTLLGLLLAAIAAAAYQRRQRQAARDVGGLVLLLSRDGAQQNSFAAEGGDRFRFVLRDEETGQPRFDRPEPTDRCYVAQRDGASVLVRLPYDGHLLLAPGHPKDLPNGLELGFRDDRPHRGRRRPAPPARFRRHVDSTRERRNGAVASAAPADNDATDDYLSDNTTANYLGEDRRDGSYLDDDLL